MIFRRRSAPPLSDAMAAAVTDPLAPWPWLDDDARARLLDVAADLLHRLRWEGTRGFAVEDAMRGLVAGHAALLVVGLDGPAFPDVETVVLHPTTDVLRGPRPGPSAGVVADGAMPVHGHTSARGPVFLAWDAAQRDASSPGRGRNVVLHEFAHRLDVADGWFDGMPSLASEARRREWAAVCQAEMELLRAGLSRGLLRPYAGTNPAEFFAVATEVFFTRGAALRASRPALHDVLAGFYRQDTAAWQDGAAPAP